MAWAVVHFLKDESVEVVPEKWTVINSNGTKSCLWPPFTSNAKIIQAVQRMESPQCDWKMFDIEILGCYDNIEKAQKKCNKARDTDELSSTADEEIRPKTTRHARKQKEHNKDYLYYSPERPKIPKSFVMSRHLPKTKECTEQIVTPSESQNQIEIENQSSEDRDVIEKENQIHQRVSQQSTIEENNFSTEIDLNVQDSTTMRHLNKDFQDFMKKSFEFQRQIIKEIFIIKCVVKDNRETLETLLKSSHRDANNNSPDDNVMELTKMLTSKLPLQFDEDLQEIEEKLGDVKVFDALAKELSLIGGNNAKDATFKLMYHIISNKLGALYSWEGQKGKRVFKNLNLPSLIFGTIRIRYKEAMESEMISAIRNWLVQAKFRENLKKKKLEQQNQKDSRTHQDKE